MSLSIFSRWYFCHSGTDQAQPYLAFKIRRGEAHARVMWLKSSMGQVNKQRFKSWECSGLPSSFTGRICLDSRSMLSTFGSVAVSPAHGLGCEEEVSRQRSQVLLAVMTHLSLGGFSLPLSILTMCPVVDSSLLLIWS